MLALCAANIAYLAGLESELPADDVCVVGGTGAALAEMYRRSGIVAMTLDEHEAVMRGIDGPLSSGVVLGAAPIVDLLESVGCDAVLPFKSGARLWRMAEFQNLRVLAAPDKLTRQLENKLALADIAAAAQAQIPDTVTVQLDDALAEAATRPGGIALPRVFQPAVGFAGAGTLLLRTSDDVAALVAASPAGSRVGKLVEYVAGEPVTINGVVIPAGVHGVDEHSEDGEVLVGMPCRQLTGVAELTPTEFGSCGNDWSLPPSRDAVIALRSLARRVGAELGRRGFFGAFGIDAVLQQGTQVPVLIEINPRWTASLALQVELQAAHSLPTFLDAHLAACAYRAEERTSLAELRAAYGDENDAGCTRTADTVSTIIAFHTGDDPVRVGPHMQPGVWRTKPSLERVRDGWRVEHLRSADEVLITPASHARDVEHGSFLVRVTMRGTAAASPEANELRPDVMRVMRDVLKVLRRGADGVS